MMTFDLIKRKMQKFNPLGLHDLRKERFWKKARNFCGNDNKNKPEQPPISSLFQDSKKTSTSTETNNISYESPNIQLFGAGRMRAWQYHGGTMPASGKTVCYFLFWGRRGQEGWIFEKKWLGQIFASHEPNKHHNLVKNSSKGILISVQSISYRVWTPCMNKWTYQRWWYEYDENANISDESNDKNYSHINTGCYVDRVGHNSSANIVVFIINLRCVHHAAGLIV